MKPMLSIFQYAIKFEYRFLTMFQSLFLWFMSFIFDKLTEVESRTQGSRPRTQKISRPRTDPLEAKDQEHRRKCSQKKKKVFKKFFSGGFYLRNPKKRSLQIFRKVSGVFQRNFNGLKIMLSSSRGQGNFRGLEALRPRPRTSICVLEDSTSAN